MEVFHQFVERMKGVHMSQYLDLVCPVAIVICFLITVPWGRKVWWVVDASACLVFGLILLVIPKYFVGFQTVGGQLDELHLLLCRVMGSFLIGSALNWYLCRDSVDLRMFGNHFFSRLVMCSFLLISQCFSAYHLWKRNGLRFNEKFLAFSCVGVGTWWLGSLVQLLRYKEIGGYVFRSSWLSTGFLLDHYCLLIVGVLHFAFPSHILKIMIKSPKTIDGVHVCLLRCVAAMQLGCSLMSNSAPGFLYPMDKKNYVLGRLLAHIACFGFLLYAHFALDMFTMYHVTPFMISGFYITFLLSLCLRFNKEKET